MNKGFINKLALAVRNNVHGILAGMLGMFQVCSLAVGQTLDGSSPQANRVPGKPIAGQFQCGPTALHYLAEALNGTNADTDEIDRAVAPVGGSSMTELIAIASRDGLNVIAARRSTGATIVVPSIVHWRRGHYSALVGRNGNLYCVQEGVEGKRWWIPREVIDQESSGHFLLPNGNVPVHWNRLGQSETDTIVGGGGTTGPCEPCDSNTNGSGGSGGSGGSSCSCGGMTVWSVSEPAMNLWLYDEPLGYSSGLGYRISFKLSYKQREETAGTYTNLFSCGQKWNFSWMSYFDTSASDGYSTNEPEMIVAGGGLRDYNANGTALEYFTATRLIMTSNTSGDFDGYSVLYANGAVDNYNYLTTNIDNKTLVFLSAKVDPAGHATQFIYGTNTNLVVKLLYVIDGDGQTNSLGYTNDLYPAQITSVTNRFGQVATLFYDTNGLLTNITDTLGLWSSFGYEDDGDVTNFWITNLSTPYGTTSFSFTDLGYPNPLGGTNIINRSVMVVDPMKGTNLYLYKDQTTNDFLPNEYDLPNGATDSSAPAGIQDNYMSYRNSWYWGPKQFSDLSTTNMNSFTATDYLMGRYRNWMHAQGTALSYTLNFEQEPSPDGIQPAKQTYYAYSGTGFTYGGAGHAAPIEGSNDQLVATAYNLPNDDGLWTLYFRDALGHITNAVEFSIPVSGPALPKTNQYFYSTNGIDMIREVGPLGETNSYSYDTNHNLVRETNAVGDVTTYQYDSQGRQTNMTTPTGLTNITIYYNSGPYSNMIYQTIELPINSTNTFTYTNNLVLTQTDERGLTVSNTYDNLQRLVCTTYPDGTTTSNIYSNLDLVETIDRLNQPTSNEYDNNRRLIAVTNALGKVSRYNYCVCGALNSVQDALSNITSYSYDNAGRVTNTVYADGSSMSQSYDFLDRVVATTDGAGVTITKDYDDFNRLLISVGPVGQLFFNQFDIEDHVTNSVDVNGIAMTSAYDPLGRLLTRTYPDGGVESFGYTNAEMFAYTNQIGKVTYYAYDAAGRKIAETNALTNLTLYGYNAAGDLTNLTDAKGNTTAWGYDMYGRVTNKVDAMTNTILTYQYDPDSRLTNRWSLAKSNTIYSYDAVGNLTNVTHLGGSPSLYFAYDAMNRLTNVVDASGTNAFGYTATGQLQEETDPWGNTVGYTYNQKHRVAMILQSPGGGWPTTYAYSYDPGWRLASITSPAGTFQYQYEIVSSVPASGYPPAVEKLIASISLPNASLITNTFDPNGRLTETRLINSMGGISDDYAYTYNQASQRTNVVRGGGIPNYANYTYDPIGEVTSDLAYESISNTVRRNEQLQYLYDAAGNLQYRTNNALVQNFQVNALNELTTNTNGGTLTVMGTTTPIATNVTVNGSNATLYGDYTFAATNMSLTNTNFTALALGNGSAATNTVTVNLAANANIQYDGNGNLTNDGWRNFVYDDDNQLVQVSVSNQWLSRFVYDGKMRRRIRTEFTWQSSAWAQTNQVRYVYDGNLVIQERDTNDQVLATYTRGNDLSGSLRGAGGIGGLLARTDTNGSTFYHADGNGNITLLINSNQVIVAKYFYDAFGNVLSKSGLLADANLYRFSSKEAHPNSGMIYYLYRYYDPNLQRWPNRDPIQEKGGLNLYEFARNDAVDRVDLVGFSPCCASGFWKGKVEYGMGSFILGYGHFHGEVKCTSDQSLEAKISGSAHGVGIAIGWIDGSAKIGFWANSSDQLIGQTAGAFVLGGDFGFGPATVVGGTETIGVVAANGSHPAQFLGAQGEGELLKMSTSFGPQDIEAYIKLALTGAVDFDFGLGADVGFVGFLVKHVEE